MTLEDIVNALRSREDIAAAAGLQARRSVSGDLVSALSIFAAGIILGAGLALLFAPKAGEEIRRDLAERVGDVGSRLYGTAPATESPST